MDRRDRLDRALGHFIGVITDTYGFVTNAAKDDSERGEMKHSKLYAWKIERLVCMREFKDAKIPGRVIKALFEKKYGYEISLTAISRSRRKHGIKYKHPKEHYEMIAKLKADGAQGRRPTYSKRERAGFKALRAWGRPPGIDGHLESLCE